MRDPPGGRIIPLLERLDPAISEVIDSPEMTQQTTAIETLF